MKKIIFILLILSSINIFAKSATAMGKGKTIQESKKEALSELANSIAVDVRSEFVSSQNVGNNFEEYKKNTNNEFNEYKKNKIIYLKSELPLLGVEYFTIPSSDGYVCEAKIDENDLVLYENEMTKMKDIINKNLKNIDKTENNSEKINLLEEILENLEKYNKYKIVAEFLSSKNFENLSITESEIENKISNLNQKIDSIEMTAKKIANKFKGKRSIFIYPFTPKNSNEVTEFSKILYTKVSELLDIVDNADYAKFYLKGEYIIKDNEMILICKISEKEGKSSDAIMLNLIKDAYKNYNIKPFTDDFNKILYGQMVLSNDFKVDITTDRGKSDLLITTKDKKVPKLLIKLNKAGYIYILNHTFRQTEKFSHILELNNSTDNRKFIMYINHDDANKWIELGDLEAFSPFGVENLHVFASEKDPIDEIPENYYDNDKEIFILGKNPAEVVFKTRGLRIKKEKKTEEIKKSEAVLTLTTMK